MFPSIVFRRAYDAIQTPHHGVKGDLEYLRILHYAATTMEAEVEAALTLLLADKSPVTASAVKALVAANGGKIAVWNQPVEVREMRKDGRWTIDEIAGRIGEVGQEEMGLLKVLAEREAAAKAAKESGTTPNQ